jgi:archaellum biogenesis ATPase FlaH
MENNWWEKHGIDLSYEHKTACPRCRRKGGDNAGNNLHCYGLSSDGSDLGAYCWACEMKIPNAKLRALLNGEEEEKEFEEVSTREKITPEENEQIKSYTGTDAKGWRGIRKDTNAFFGIRYSYDEETGQPDCMFVPTTINGELAGYRRRIFPKDFSAPVGQVGKECDMVGAFRFKAHTHTCIITGGETKMALTYQMMRDNQIARGKDEYESTAVVCSTLGEPGAHKQAQLQYTFFDQFKKIVICMDADDAGREAAEKLAKVLPKGRVFVMNMRYKDADIYVEKSKEDEFIRDFWNAKAYTPDGIVASGSLMEKVLAAARVKRIPLPPFMHKAQEMMAGGIPLGVIVNLASASGTGKSTIVDECTYFWVFNSPHKIGVVSLESDAGQYGTKILSRHIQHKIDLIANDDERVEFLQRPEVVKAGDELWFNEDGSHRWYVVDERDGGVESLKKQVEELVIACECKVILLDPIQDIFEGMSTDEQAQFMKWQKGMVKSHKISFINVNHVRKSSQGQKANSTGADLHEEDMHGTGSILKSGACNLLFMRDKEAEDSIERNTTRMKMTKCRWTGKTGVAGEYYYDNDTHTLFDKEDWMRQNPATY